MASGQDKSSRWDVFWNYSGGAWLFAGVLLLCGTWAGYFGLTNAFLTLLETAGVKAIAGTLLWTGVGLVAGIPLLMYLGFAAIGRWGPKRWTHLKEASRWGRLASILAVVIAAVFALASAPVTWPVLLGVAAGLPLLFFFGRWGGGVLHSLPKGNRDYQSKPLPGKRTLDGLVEQISGPVLSSMVASEWALKEYGRKEYGRGASLDDWGVFLLAVASKGRTGWVQSVLAFKPDGLSLPNKPLKDSIDPKYITQAMDAAVGAGHLDVVKALPVPNDRAKLKGWQAKASEEGRDELAAHFANLIASVAPPGQSSGSQGGTVAGYSMFGGGTEGGDRDDFPSSSPSGPGGSRTDSHE